MLAASAFWQPVALSIRVSLIASFIVLPLGIAAAWVLVGRRPFPGRLALETIFLLPLVLPPTVVGFLLLLAIGRRSPLGRLAEWLLAQPIVFTWEAAVLASVVVAFPLVYQSVKVGFAGVDRALLDAARVSGASEWRVLLHITLPLAARSLLSAYVLGFARSLGEFGATLMVAGSIPGKTLTIPSAIYVAVEAGGMDQAWRWAAVTVGLSFVLLFAVGRRQGSSD